MSFSETIRRYRKERGWTLQELSQLAGLSVAQLSKLETGKSDPSLDSLRKLAAIYGVAVPVLSRHESSERLAPVRKDGGFVVQSAQDGRVTLRYLTMRCSAKILSIEAVLPGRSSLELGQLAPNEVFFYVVRGGVNFYFGEEEACTLKEGDSLYFDGYVPHRWENSGEEEALFLICGDLPRM